MEECRLTQSKSSLHYGWLVVFGGFLTQIILMCGVQFVPILMAPIKQSLELSNTSAGTIVSVFGLCYAGCSFIWGYLADRAGARTAVSLAGLVLGIAVILFGLLADSFLKAVLIIALVGFGAAGVYSATIPKLIGAWFHPSKRGRAMSTITAGGVLTGAAFGIVLPQLAKAYGWQTAAVILGVLAIICTVVIYLVVRNKPSEKGLIPVGTPADQVVKAAPVIKDAGFKDVLKMKVTWHVSSMFIFWQVAYMTATAFVAVSFVNAGFTAVQGGLAVTIYNLCQLIGQQIWGPLSDRLERKTVICIAGIWWTAATLGYMFIYGSTLNAMYILIGVMGVGMGMVPVILASFSDYFPTEVGGSGAGVVSTMGLVGRFFGPMLAGYAADATGSITGAFGVGAAAMLLASLVAFSLPSLKKQAVVSVSGESAK